LAFVLALLVWRRLVVVTTISSLVVLVVTLLFIIADVLIILTIRESNFGKHWADYFRVPELFLLHLLLLMLVYVSLKLLNLGNVREVGSKLVRIELAHYLFKILASIATNNLIVVTRPIIYLITEYSPNHPIKIGGYHIIIT
jgi:hypothetical protein